MRLRISILTFGSSIKTYGLKLNLFHTGIEDELIIKSERRTTRLYLCLLILSILLFNFYYTFIPYKKTYILKSPTLTHYLKLEQEYSLKCPCKRIAIRYEEYVKMKPLFHPLCEHLYKLYEQTINKTISTHIHRIAVFQFQTLRQLCQLTQNILNENLQIFLQTNLIQIELISFANLEKKMLFLIENFVNSTSKTSMRTLNFIENRTEQNLLMTGASITSILPRNQYRQFVQENIPYDGMTYTFLDQSTFPLLTNDSRYQSEFHFQLLSTLCQMANETIEDSIELFNQTKFLSNKLYHPELFQIQMNLLIEQLKKTISESFQRIIEIIKINYEINQFITPNEFLFSLDKNECLSDMILPDFCMCFLQASYQCSQKTILKEINDNYYTIPGMFQTWFPFQSLLISTLECFYDQICLSHIINSSSSNNITILNSLLLPSDKHRHDQIETIVKNVFIQSWKISSSFQSYFNQCNPLICQYSYQNRVNFIYIITTMIGIIGGINIVLRLVLPFIIQLIMKYLNEPRQHNSTRKIRLYFVNIKQRLIRLNLFITIPITNDRKIVQRNRCTTRIYLILLLTSFSLLIIYTLLKQETIAITIESPSFSTYE
ncbi:hypothetical protein I4U23_016351 [Adineta vaga]|nr:hypothetical protein I4U23_016351 [Adineta vaga]